MTVTAKRYEIDLAEATRIWAAHLASVAGEGSQVRHLTAITIRRFLFSFTVSGEPSRFVIDSQSVRQWLIQDVRGKSIRYATERLSIVDQFLKTLVQAGLIDVHPLAEFRIGFGKPSWSRLVHALQSDEPDENLVSLRQPVPPLGPLAVYVQTYLELHLSLGKKYNGQRSTLHDLDRYLQTQAVVSPWDIKQTMIENWASTLACTARVRIHKARYAWRFFDYLRSLSVINHNPVPSTLTSPARFPRSSFKPFIFSREQIATLLEEAKRLPETCRIRCRAPQTYFTMLVLLCSLGLRHGEVLRLRIRDLDLAEQTLFIAQTKFHKSRYVPFGPKVGQCLKRYLEIRNTLLQPVHEDDPLFTTKWRKTISPRTLLDVYRRMLHTLNITGIPGQNPPRLHDLRHTFAVHRLLRWYREGVAVQSRLPTLATFMGHVQPQSTEIYLTITADLLQEANARFFQHFGQPGDKQT